jgi:undecaprenyl-diphosphatase
MLDFSFFIFLQIVSESFPISSSGHIALMICVMNYFNMPQYEAIATFFASPSMLFLLHVPTIFIVAFFFRNQWRPLLFQLLRWHRIIIKLIYYAFVADCMTVIWYLIFLYFPISFPLSIGFGITAAMLFSLQWCYQNDTILKLRHMVLLGCIQGIALLPGVSRFGSVYVICRWLGIRATKSFGIAWMIQWPLMVAGMIVTGMQSIVGNVHFQSQLFLEVMLGVVIASIIAFIGLFAMYLCAQKNLIWAISFYMLVPLFISLCMGC